MMEHQFNGEEAYVYPPFNNYGAIWDRDYDCFVPVISSVGNGPKGDKGQKGDRGPTGLTGPAGPKGPKGDTFTFADLSADQIDQLRNNIATAFVRKTEVVLTPSQTTNTIAYPSEISDGDFFFIDINGLNLNEGSDYTVNPGSRTITFRGNSVNRNTPLHFIIFKMLAVAPGDMEALRGPQGDPLTYDDLTAEQIAELKGDPFTFADLTPEQINQLKTDVSASVMVKYDFNANLSGTTVNIPSAYVPYIASAMFFVDANGLSLEESSLDDLSSYGSNELLAFAVDSLHDQIVFNKQSSCLIHVVMLVASTTTRLDIAELIDQAVSARRYEIFTEQAVYTAGSDTSFRIPGPSVMYNASPCFPLQVYKNREIALINVDWDVTSLGSGGSYSGANDSALYNASVNWIGSPLSSTDEIMIVRTWIETI